MQSRTNNKQTGDEDDLVSKMLQALGLLYLIYTQDSDLSSLETGSVA